MEFLKNHYEKIVLTVLLVLFVLSLFYLINVIKTVQGVAGSDLHFPEIKPDYTSISFDADIYNIAGYVKKMPLWQKRLPLNPADKVYTKLVEPYPIAQCPHKGCKKYIALDFFMNEPHKCPFCGGELPKPQTSGPVVGDDVDDDGDRFPDRAEKEFGLNATDPNDGLKDLDNDGFPNWFEYKNKTGLNDVKSHPSLCLRLYVTSITRNKLPVELKKLLVKGENRDDWDIQIDVKTKKGGGTKFLKLNGTFKILNEEFKIVDCRAKKETIIDPKTKMEIVKDISEVTIQSVKGDEKIVMVEKEDVYSSKEKVVLTDISDEKVFRVMMGDSFKMGNKDTGIETYKVVNVDSAKNVVQLVNEADNKIYDVSSQKRFDGPEHNPSAALEGGMPPEMAVPMAPTTRPTNRRTPRR